MPDPDDGKLSMNSELDLLHLASAIRRQWRVLFFSATIGLFGAQIITTTTPQEWEGEFQIVVSNKSDNNSASGLSALANSSQALANLAGVAGVKNEIETEIEILKSPFILQPIFTKERLRNSASNRNSAINFNDWVNGKLTVKVVKGTTVLDVKYRDFSKDAVLDVLRSISKAYQRYSYQNRTASIQSGIRFSAVQSEIYRKKVESANRKLDAYRLRYGLQQSASRISAISDIANLTSSSLQAPGSIGSPISTRYGDPLSQLAGINQEIFRRKQVFHDNDPSIIALERERAALRKYIESTSGGALALPGKTSLSQEQAQEIVLTHAELERTADRYSRTLNTLGNTLQNLLLENAKIKEPWDLISTPTLIEKPVSPKPTRNLAIGLLGGLLVGCGLTLMIDRISGRIFDVNEVTKYLDCLLLAELPSSPDDWSAIAQLISAGPLLNSHNVSLVRLGDCDTICAQLKIALERCCGQSTNIIISQFLSDALPNQTLLLVASPGSINRKDLESFRQLLQLHTGQLAGLIWHKC
jgi:succinoglycan biosynthesis transport protein ExoP